MKILDLYIAKAFIRIFLLVLAVPGLLFSFFEFLSQLDDVGKGAYGMREALMFVLMTLPGRLEDLLPMTVLLAGMISLGMLADRAELLAMEASGMSVLRISAPVLGACLVLMVIAAAASELVIPDLESRARSMRMHSMSSGMITVVKHGFWARVKGNIIHVENSSESGMAYGVEVYEFEHDSAAMKSFVQARQAVISNGRWVLREVKKKVISDSEVITRNIPEVIYEGLIDRRQVAALRMPPEALSTPELLKYIDALRHSGQNTRHYTLALWQKIMRPFTTAAMAFLALTFVFGPVREKGAGFRIVVGSFVGLFFYFAHELVVHIGTFLDVPSAVVAAVPAAAVGAIAAIRWKSMECS